MTSHSPHANGLHDVNALCDVIYSPEIGADRVRTVVRTTRMLIILQTRNGMEMRFSRRTGKMTRGAGLLTPGRIRAPQKGEVEKIHSRELRSVIADALRSVDVMTCSLDDLSRLGKSLEAQIPKIAAAEGLNLNIREG